MINVKIACFCHSLPYIFLIFKIFFNVSCMFVVNLINLNLFSLCTVPSGVSELAPVWKSLFTLAVLVWSWCRFHRFVWGSSYYCILWSPVYDVYTTCVDHPWYGKFPNETLARSWGSFIRELWPVLHVTKWMVAGQVASHPSFCIINIIAAKAVI